MASPRPPPRHANIQAVKLVEAQFENGVLRPDEQLHLRSGERVSLMIIQKPDPRRWNLAALADSGGADDLALAEQGLAEWVEALEEKDRS